MSDKKVKMKKSFYRPTWVEIDLSALEYNIKQIKKLVSKNVKILCVVKADGYGHGMIQVAKKINRCGVDYFGIASIDEGITLRKQGIKKPILILENSLKEHAKYIIDYNLTQSVCTKESALSLNNYAKRKKKIAKIHIKIDTGMGRLGIWHKQALAFIKNINKLKSLQIEGIYTHFPSADTDKKFTNYQIRCFNTLIKKIKQNNINIPFCHAANSIGLVDYKNSHLNLVRPGIILYGIYPKKNMQSKIKLKPVLSFKTKIIYLKKIPTGRSISYGRTYVSQHPTTIATLPVGYSDGYLRGLSNKAEVIIKGRRFRVVGRVCMDQTMVDLRNSNSVKIGDTAVLVGKQGKESIALEELSKHAGTIPYELACSIGKSSSCRFFKSI